MLGATEKTLNLLTWDLGFLFIIAGSLPYNMSHREVTRHYINKDKLNSEKEDVPSLGYKNNDLNEHSQTTRIFTYNMVGDLDLTGLLKNTILKFDSSYLQCVKQLKVTIGAVTLPPFALAHTISVLCNHVYVKIMCCACVYVQCGLFPHLGAM